jgi:GH24 family phage-related lysozyme (muramidase)
MRQLITLLLIYIISLQPIPETGRAKCLCIRDRVNTTDTLYDYSVRVIKKYEGYRKFAYNGLSHTCIGYGELKRYVKEDSLSEHQADSVLRRHFNKDIENVKLLVKTRDKRTILTLAMFSYNCGIGRLNKSKLIKLINSGAELSEIEKAYKAHTFAKGKHLKGLVKRRKDEFLIK